MVVKKQDLTPAFALEKLAVLVLQPAIVAKDEELRVVGKEPGFFGQQHPAAALAFHQRAATLSPFLFQIDDLCHPGRTPAFEAVGQAAPVSRCFTVSIGSGRASVYPASRLDSPRRLHTSMKWPGS